MAGKLAYMHRSVLHALIKVVKHLHEIDELTILNIMDSASRKEKALGFLRENRLATVAIIDADRIVPTAAYMYYLIYDNTLYVATTKDSQKIYNIKANPHVALVIAQEIMPKTLQLEGVARIEEQNQPDLIAQYARVANSNQSDVLPPLVHLSKDSEMVFMAITITHYKFSDFSEPEKLIIEGSTLF